MKGTTKNGAGSSFTGTTVKLSVNELIEILGSPDYDRNDGKDKVNFEWNRETDSGKYFSVYDWKHYREIGINEIIEWHIGGFNRESTEIALEEILTKHKLHTS